MKNVFRPSSCGCGSRAPAPPRPPERPWRPCEPEVCPLPPICSGGYLMQRILAVGRLHSRRVCCPISLDALPVQAVAPYTVVSVCACGLPLWDEIPGRRRDCLLLRVTVALSVQVRDGCGSLYNVSAQLTEELPLRFEYPPDECWRGQPTVQAAVRLAGRPCPCDSRCCEAPLEVMMEGYVLSSCAWGQGCAPGSPPARPWYPEPIAVPYYNR